MSYRNYTMTEKRDKMASARKMREMEPTLAWGSIANYLNVPLSTLRSWLEDGIDGGTRGRPPGEVRNMVKDVVNEVFDERGIPRREE